MQEIQNLANQSLARPLSANERAFADALFDIFAKTHQFEDIARELEERRVAAPSGDSSPWTVEKLATELRLANASFDDAYRGNLPDHVATF